MSNEDFDLVIIGAGPGGYVAAIRASQLGLRVGIIEKNVPGGVCLNLGCIPSKSLIYQSEIFRSIAELESLGVICNKENFSYEKVFNKSRKAANQLSKGVEYLLDKNKVKYYKGTAKLIGTHKISIDDDTVVSSDKILLATGSRPREIQGLPFDYENIISSDTMLMQKKLPKRLAIVGGGAIGVEFAHIMNAFGVQVHIIEILEHLLPKEDDDIANTLHKSFKNRGINIHTATKVAEVKFQKDEISLSIENSNKFELIDVNKVLLVTGRKPNTESLGLEELGIKVERGFVNVGPYYQTSIPNIYAIGDIINTPMLAHVASKEGEIAVEHLAGIETKEEIDRELIPFVVYCEPQVASFGISEREAKDSGINYKIGMFPYRASGKAVAINKGEGYVKTIFDASTDELIGASIIGAEASEMIHELLVMKSSELLVEDISTMIHAHPTLSETVMEATKAVKEEAIHI